MSATYQAHDGPQQLEQGLRDQIGEEIASMARRPLRVLGFGYFEMELQEWEENFENQARELEQALDEQAIGLTFLAAVGLKDSLRPRAASAVDYAQKESGLSIRMVSGDHKETATKVALRAGILSKEEL